MERLRAAVLPRETDDDLLAVTEPLEEPEPELLCDLPLVRRHDVPLPRDPLERVPLTDDLVLATVVRLEAETPTDVAPRPAVTDDLELRELVDLLDLAGLAAEKPLFEEPFRDLLVSVVVLLDGVEGLAESLDLLCGDRVERDLFDPSDPRVEEARVAPGAERVRKEADDAGVADRCDLTA